MSNSLPGPHDNQLFNRPKNDYKRFNNPTLPNGEKPDFGYGKKTQKQQQQQKPQKTPQKNNKNKNRQGQTHAGDAKLNIHKSPLNPHVQLLESSPVFTKNSNYKLANVENSSPGTPSSKLHLKNLNYAGSTFHNSPETKSLPKPSFL